MPVGPSRADHERCDRKRTAPDGFGWRDGAPDLSVVRDIPGLVITDETMGRLGFHDPACEGGRVQGPALV
jgi:hypothetical protein